MNSFSLEKTLETDPSFLDENKENMHNSRVCPRSASRWRVSSISLP